jgi:hypothetical protein
MPDTGASRKRQIRGCRDRSHLMSFRLPTKAPKRAVCVAYSQMIVRSDG